MSQALQVAVLVNAASLQASQGNLQKVGLPSNVYSMHHTANGLPGILLQFRCMHCFVI